MQDEMTLGEARWGGVWEIYYFFANFSVDLKLVQNLKLKKIQSILQWFKREHLRPFHHIKY